ncbi:MAG: insulinase family protein, partial [bacterium]
LVDSVARMLKVGAERPPDGKQTFKSRLPRVHGERRKVSQSYICMGTAGPHFASPRRHAHMLLSMIIGGGMTSRLFQQVRDKEGLAYTVYGSCEFYRDTGIFYIFLAVDPKLAKTAVARVSRELKRLKTRGLGRGELKSVKQQLKGGLLLGLESSAARMNRLARHEIYLNAYRTVDQSIETIRRVREDDVMEEAERLLKPSAFSMVTVGPSWTEFPSKSNLSF